MKPCLFFLFTVFAGISSGQEPVFHHYSTNEGLPSSETYDILQDKKGYMWFATDRGAARFDGYRFTNFTTAEGLTNNTVLKISEDEKGRIWFLTITSELCYFENGKINKYPYNNKIKQGKASNITSFHCDKDDNLTIGFISKGLLQVDSRGNVRQLLQQHKKYRLFSADYIRGKLFVSSLASDDEYNTDTFCFSFSDASQIIKFLLRKNLSFQVNITGIRQKNGNFLFNVHGNTIVVSGKKINAVTSSDEEFIRFYEDGDSCLWAGLWNKGVRKYAPGTGIFSKNYETYLPDETITCIYGDRDGGLWLTSLNNGVFYAPNCFLKVKSFPGKEAITSLALDETTGTLYVGFSNGKIVAANSGLEIKNLDWCSKPNGHIYSAFPTGSLLVVSDKEGFSIFRNEKKILTLAKGYSRSMVLRKNIITGIANYSLFFIDTSNFSFHTLQQLPVRGEIVYTDNRNRLLVGDHSGLFVLRDSMLREAFPEIPLLRSRISAISETGDKRLAVSTIGNGLIIINADSSFIHLSSEKGLASNIINCMWTKGEHIWLGTNNGISHVVLTDSEFTTDNYSVCHGLPGNEIMQITGLGDFIFAATKKELLSLDTKKIKKNFPGPAVYIHTVVSESHSFENYSAPNEIYYNDFPLTIHYTGISYRLKGKVNYRYRLKGLDDTWQYTQSTTAGFLSLPAGEYVFEVQAQNEDGIWSPKSAGFSFIIIPPFWKTGWFLFLMLFFIIVAITLIAWLRIRFIKRRNKLLTDLLTYRQQALTMQMNPHFIFNSLNSIQSFILTEEKKLATKYISKFAKLMRTSLENSRNEYITLQNETDALHLYLELEKLRFKDLFTYSIKTDPVIDTEKTMIPSMLIQPYIENCVKHAFTETGSEQGWIEVRVLKANGLLTCEIEDNGKGIEHLAPPSEKTTHRSAGMQITENRLRLICQSLGQTFGFSIKDKRKNSSDPRSKGTLITFTLPFKELS